MGASFRNMHSIGKALRDITSSFKIYDFVTIGDELYRELLSFSSFTGEETTETEGRISYTAHFKDGKNSKWSIKTCECDPGPLKYGISKLRFIEYVKHNGQIIGKPKVCFGGYIKTKDRRKITDYVAVDAKEG